MRATNPGMVPDSPFLKPLTDEQLAFFETFPKAELLTATFWARSRRKRSSTSCANRARR